MKYRRTSERDSVLDDLEKTHPQFKLCNYEDLARLRSPQIWTISNKARFYNDVSEKILQAWDDISSMFYLMPESYRKKLITAKEFENMFTNNIFSFLEQDIDKKERQKKLRESEDEILMLYKLYSTFLRIGLSGMLNLMPYEFGHILRSQMQQTFDMMQAISSYGERIAPTKAKRAKFPFSPHELGL